MRSSLRRDLQVTVAYVCRQIQGALETAILQLDAETGKFKLIFCTSMANCVIYIIHSRVLMLF